METSCLLQGRQAERHVEATARVAVACAAHAPDGVERGGVNVQALVDACIIDMNVDDLAEYDVAAAGRAGVGADDLERAAFKARWRLCDAWGAHDARGNWRQAADVELTLPPRERLGAGDGGSYEAVRDNVHNELACAALVLEFGVGERILFAAVGVVGGAEEKRHGVGTDAGEEGEGRKVVAALRVGGRNQGDGAWQDAADEKLVAIRDCKHGGVEFHAVTIGRSLRARVRCGRLAA